MLDLKKRIGMNQGKWKTMLLIFLLAFLSFGLGYLFASYQTQEPLIIEDFTL